MRPTEGSLSVAGYLPDWLFSTQILDESLLHCPQLVMLMIFSTIPIANWLTSSAAKARWRFFDNAIRPTTSTSKELRRRRELVPACLSLHSTGCLWLFLVVDLSRPKS